MISKKKIYSIDKVGNKKEIEYEVKKKKKEDLSEMVRYSSIGYYLITPLLIAICGGLWIDDYLRTRPLFTVVFIIIGTIATFYNLFKLVNEGRSTRPPYKH